MRFEEVYPAIPRFFPFFGERVCILFRRLLEKLAGKDLRDIDAVMKRLESVLDVETKSEDKRLMEVAAEVEAGSLRFGHEV